MKSVCGCLHNALLPERNAGCCRLIPRVARSAILSERGRGEHVDSPTAVLRNAAAILLQHPFGRSDDLLRFAAAAGLAVAPQRNVNTAGVFRHCGRSYVNDFRASAACVPGMPVKVKKGGALL